MIRGELSGTAHRQVEVVADSMHAHEERNRIGAGYKIEGLFNPSLPFLSASSLLSSRLSLSETRTLTVSGGARAEVVTAE